MNSLHSYLCQRLDGLLAKHRIVVFYDPRSEFLSFFNDELEVVGLSGCGLPRVSIQERLTYLARFEGSLLALRDAVEPIAGLAKPDPLLLYLPGVERDRQMSVLMELDKAGTTYEPQLNRLARHVLLKQFTDGQIDVMLRSQVSYADIVALLQQSQVGAPSSVLRTLFSGAQSEILLSRWLADTSLDASIDAKGALPELLQLIESRLGLALPTSTSIAAARDKTFRYVLINEFRADLQAEPPASLSYVPEPALKEQADRLRSVAGDLRTHHANSYAALADQLETSLGLAAAGIEAAHLGSIDTFRFEEQALLTYVGETIAAKDYTKALAIVADRNRSFWVDRQVSRQAQWEACRLMAELGQQIEQVRPALAKAPNAASQWVELYSADDGWFLVDALQRRLETWVARMDDDPEHPVALECLRRDHEELLKRMADGFTTAVRQGGWSVAKVLPQARIHPEVVQTMHGRVAYVVVDAMRFEMGAELARHLDGARDLTLRPAIAALPTITTVGMAALLPGASASFSLKEAQGRLAACIDGRAMPGLSERLKYLKARVPGVVDLPLGRLLSLSAGKLQSTVAEAALVLVRSQEIDALGENVDELTARSAMESVIGNVARAIRKLAKAGIESFVITADHGHQFSIRKDDDMKTDNPGGNTLELHRRCWIGHGGSTPPGTVRVSGSELGYDTDLDFVFPTGLGVFKAGGGLSFHHGSVSLQELVIPVLSLRIPSQPSAADPAGADFQLYGLPKALTNRTFEVRLVLSGGLFASTEMPLRLVLLSDGEQVGQAGMAIGARLDRETGLLHVKPNTEARVGLMLLRDDCASIRVVVVEPLTDAVLAQSAALPVSLAM
jgi:hypothetical protein